MGGDREFKTAFSKIFSRPLPKQFPDIEAARMRDNETPRAFHSRCESLIPCIKMGDCKLAQWNFLNKLADSDSWREAMKMWVSDRRWGDILAIIKIVVHLQGQETPQDRPRGR